MEPEIYPMKPSSNPDGKPGLSNPDKDAWSSDENDKKPSVTITVDDEEDKYIDSVTITETDNVDSVTVVVINKDDGTEVSCLDIVYHQLFFFLF